MTDFPEHNCENMGGLSTFNFIQQYGIESMPFYSSNQLTVAIIVKLGYAWLIGRALLKSLSFSDTIKQSDAGDLHEYLVSGIYPGQTSEISGLFDEMKDQPLLVDIIDNNNQRRLLGSLTNPVIFKYSYSSKDQPGSRPEYSFSFSWTSPNPAPFYNPT